MNTPENIKAFVIAARECAIQMMQNAIYIEANYPSIELPNEMTEKVKSLCQTFISTKHEVMTELFELDVRDATSTDLDPKIDRITQWLSEPIHEMNEIIVAIREANEQDRHLFLELMLLTESAINIINPFNEAWDAAKALE